MTDAYAAADALGYPLIVRPSFTMGGAGSGMAYTASDLDRIAGAGLDASPTSEVLLEESILGWKEYELEVMRDRADNVVIVCSIENVDPMGVHTGDSITVAPAMTLTDREYQRLRDLSIGIIREVGVDTGGCNIQFAVDPADGRVIVIEMNPRVSRSSALASKATGFPIAKIAALVALGYTLDEIDNDITKVPGRHPTPASFEPTLDYVVVKVPRFNFEKFPGADPILTTHMKSVGEAMAIGRNFTEALNKALRSLEKTGSQFCFSGEPGDMGDLLQQASRPHDGRDRRAAGRGDRDRPVVLRPVAADPRDRRGGPRRGRAHRTSSGDRQAPWLLRRADRRDPRHAGGRGPRRPLGAGDPAGLQDRRHLRRGVRCRDPLPLLQLRRGERGAAA
jgi:carbamoyl-phosphate synthase large subunit